MSEHQEQCALFEWAALNETKYPELKWMFAVPNGGKRHIAVAVRLKVEGVKPGVPDVLLPIPHGGYNGLAIEMKFGKNQATPEQRKWLAALVGAGWLTKICWNWTDAADTLVDYLESKQD